jgi:hypothetical protein
MSLNLKKNKYTLKQKQKIVDKIYDITDDDILHEFNKLVEIGCKKHAKLSHMGSKVVNKFTSVERLNTVYNLYRKKRICFYDIIHNKNTLKKQKRIKQMLAFYKKTNKDYPETKVWFRISNLYYNAISIFNPLIAMDIYCKFKPKSILDFTMGWGGRLVGACALNIEKYIGIDNNQNLAAPYQKMKTFLNQHSKTEIDLYFKDALTVDYSKLDYDLVLTSPPYYNIELYSQTKEQSNEQWNNDFYIPIFQKTFQHLKKGGYYCLNIPIDVYENVALKTLGKPKLKFPLPKAKRHEGKLKQEFIYVWAK